MALTVGGVIEEKSNWRRYFLSLSGCVNTIQQHNGKGSDAFLSAGKAEVFRRGCLDIDPPLLHLQVGTDMRAHGINERRQFRTLGNDGDIGIDGSSTRLSMLL
jgi:hypothetical protein